MSRACWDTKVRLQKVQLRGPVTMPCDDFRENMFRESFVACPAHKSSGKQRACRQFQPCIAASPSHSRHASTLLWCFVVFRSMCREAFSLEVRRSRTPLIQGQDSGFLDIGCRSRRCSFLLRLGRPTPLSRTARRGVCDVRLHLLCTDPSVWALVCPGSSVGVKGEEGTTESVCGSYPYLARLKCPALPLSARFPTRLEN